MFFGRNCSGGLKLHLLQAGDAEARICVLTLVAMFNSGQCSHSYLIAESPRPALHHFSLCWLFCSLLLTLPAAPGEAGCYQQIVSSALTSFSRWTFLQMPQSWGCCSVGRHWWHHHCQQGPFVPAQIPAHGQVTSGARPVFAMAVEDIAWLLWYLITSVFSCSLTLVE